MGSIKVIVIGGSWGGIQASLTLLKNLPINYSIPIVLVLHRLKNFESDLEEVYRKNIKMKVREIEEKEKVEQGFVYIAPPNYHVLFESDLSFSLDSSELENYSRPSIDVTFESAAKVLGDGVMGILLSGANKDGSIGLGKIVENGGKAIVQDPLEAEVDTMPKSAINLVKDCKIYKLDEMQKVLISLID